MNSTVRNQALQALVLTVLAAGCASAASAGVPAACTTLEEAETLSLRAETLGDLRDVSERYRQAADQLPERHSTTARSLDQLAATVRGVLDIAIDHPESNTFDELPPAAQAQVLDSEERLVELEAEMLAFSRDHC